MGVQSPYTATIRIERQIIMLLKLDRKAPLILDARACLIANKSHEIITKKRFIIVQNGYLENLKYIRNETNEVHEKQITIGMLSNYKKGLNIMNFEVQRFNNKNTGYSYSLIFEGGLLGEDSKDWYIERINDNWSRIRIIKNCNIKTTSLGNFKVENKIELEKHLLAKVIYHGNRQAKLNEEWAKA